MKKRLAAILVLVLLLSGCGREKAPAVLPTETSNPAVPELEIPLPPETTVPEPEETEQTEQTEPVPDTEPVTVVMDNTPVFGAMLHRGDTVQCVAEQAGYYVIELENRLALVEKDKLRPEAEQEPESWQGYTAYGAVLWGSFRLRGEQTPLNGSMVEVLDEFDNCYLVRFGEQVGYAAKSQVSAYPFQYSSGGDGSSGASDGGDISLTGFSAPAAESSAFTPCTAKVKADDTETILGFFTRGDVAEKIVEPGYSAPADTQIPVLLESGAGYIRKDMVLQNGQSPFDTWDGYAAGKTLLYDTYLLTGEPVTVWTNAILTVTLELEEGYRVEYQGKVYFAEKAQVSRYPIQIAPGNSDGEWTPPVM